MESLGLSYKTIRFTGDEYGPLDELDGPTYAAMLEHVYNDRDMQDFLEAIEVSGKEVIEEAITQADSVLLRDKKAKAYSEKDLWERLESPKGMLNNIHKNACIVDLSQKIQDTLKDATVGEGVEAKQKAVLGIIKKQVGEWKTADPKMNEMESRRPGIIKECVNKAIDLCKTTPETNAKLKEVADKAFLTNSTNSVAKQKEKDTRSR